MKKNLLTGMVYLLLISFVSCDKTDELNSAIDSYYTLNASFIFPDPENLNKTYAILFNGDTLDNDLKLVSRTNPNGVLQIIERKSNAVVFDQEVTLAGNTSFQFIKLGDNFDTYSEDKYAQFTVDIKWATFGERAKYKATYDGVELNTEEGNKNYALKDELTGIFQLEKIDDGSLVLDREVTIEPNGTLLFLQLSTTEFLALASEEEEAPESDDYKKIRVYYTLTDELKEASYIIKFYAFDSWVYDKDQTEELESFEINAGEISPYVLVYGRTFEGTTAGPTYLTYDLIAKDGTIVREHDPNSVQIAFDGDENWDIDYFKYLSKFQTFNINNAAFATLVLEEKW